MHNYLKYKQKQPNHIRITYKHHRPEGIRVQGLLLTQQTMLYMTDYQYIICHFGAIIGQNDISRILAQKLKYIGQMLGMSEAKRGYKPASCLPPQTLNNNY